MQIVNYAYIYSHIIYAHFIELPILRQKLTASVISYLQLY